MYPYRRNADRDLRDLEREAAQGDPEAALRLENMRFRLGTSLKNVDLAILLSRLDHWFDIVSDLNRYLLGWWEFPDEHMSTPSAREVSRWKSEITQALSEEPVNHKLLATVAYQLNSYEEEISEFLAESERTAEELTGYGGEPLSISSVWEDGAGAVLAHLRSLIRVYQPKSPRTIAWEDVSRDNYSNQDEMADNIVFIATGDRLKGRLERRGPPFMVIISPRFKEEIRLAYAGESTIYDDENCSHYEGSWRGHTFDVSEILLNQWHVTVDGESSLVEWGELGDQWQDATKLIGEWIDKWIMDNLSWLGCDSCKKAVIHDDKNCRVCNATQIYDLERDFSEHLCYLCLYHSDGEDFTQLCSRCATICGRCDGVVCQDNYHATSCKECGMTLCDNLADCGARCGGCDASMCWECRKAGSSGSLCSECFKEDF